MQLDLLFYFYLRIDCGNRFWVRLVDFRCIILLVLGFTPADKFDEKDEDDEDECSNKGKNELYKGSVFLALLPMSFWLPHLLMEWLLGS